MTEEELNMLDDLDRAHAENLARMSPFGSTALNNVYLLDLFLKLACSRLDNESVEVSENV